MYRSHKLTLVKPQKQSIYSSQWYPAYTNTCLHYCRANEVSEQWAVAYDSWQPKRTEQTLLSIVDKVDAILPVYLPYIPIETLNFQVVGLMPWKYSQNNLYTYTLGVHVGQRKVYELSCTTRFTGSAKTAKVFRPTVIFLTTSFILRPKLADCNIAS